MTEVPESPQQVMNPWLSMWIRPRGTIRHLVDSSPRMHATMLAAISGVYQILVGIAVIGIPLLVVLFGCRALV